MAGSRAFFAVVRRAMRGVLGASWRALSSDPGSRRWERVAVRIVVPFAFASAGLVATVVAYRTGRPPAVAFGNHLVFAGELLVLGFYGVLLVLVPLIRAIGNGELPIELTAKGARFSEQEPEDSLMSAQGVSERVEALEAGLEGQEARSESAALQAAEGLVGFEDDLADLRARLEEFERKVG